jgi:hypothetical protein
VNPKTAIGGRVKAGIQMKNIKTHYYKELKIKE